MACGCVVITAVLVVIILTLFHKVKKFLKTPPVPFLEETWWGPRDQSEEDTSIKPFTISVSDEVIADLRNRLNNARPLIPPLEGIQQQYGLNTNLLSKIVNYWRTEYDWKAREKFLNQFPQFTVSIQGLRLHYIHVKPSSSEGVRVLPLLLLHGWPGSVREFYEIIPLLTSPQPGCDFVFEVIVPSLPGYGFSEAAVRPGLATLQMAVIFNNLMKRLGFEKYYIQGGDWGAFIVQNMAILFPNQVLGVHTNMQINFSLLGRLKLILGSFYPTLLVKKEDLDKVYPLMAKFKELIGESGYMHLQATKPDTVGVGLNDSPVGLAAYILEKFITWTNPDWKSVADGNLTIKYTYEALLDNVMIYWVTNSVTTSMRLYAENFTKLQTTVNKIPVTVPAAHARFRNDLAYVPTAVLKEKFKNLVHVSDYDGGHFAAFEEPQLLADDIFKAIQIMEVGRI